MSPAHPDGAESPAPLDLETAFRAGYHACDAGRGIEGAWERFRPHPSGGAAPDCEINRPRATIRLYGLLGDMKDVPEILTEAAQTAQSLMDYGMIRFRTPTPSTKDSQP